MQENFLYRNLANVTSILGVLPLVLLFFDGLLMLTFIDRGQQSSRPFLLAFVSTSQTKTYS